MALPGASTKPQSHRGCRSRDELAYASGAAALRCEPRNPRLVSCPRSSGTAAVVARERQPARLTSWRPLECQELEEHTGAS